MGCYDKTFINVAAYIIPSKVCVCVCGGCVVCVCVRVWWVCGVCGVCGGCVCVCGGCV